ncbi:MULTISPECIES: hypothetical protein [Parabacteroides]|uniref:hypothetical protein n=1 Tax=Parabacteroides leei TaxID=2939491 RepID=UPI001896FA68|nr:MULTISPECIES: hypothetical protein [Parabacteroides]MCL3850015.1 hypothetical protein [Parabacteroides leei]
MQQIQNKPLTPLEKLISDKERIRRQCVMQEQKLNEDFSYIQENAGSLLISGFTALLFPNTKSKKTDPSEPAASPIQPATPIGFSDYLSIAQGLLPVAWDVVRPFLLTWGIRKAQSWFTGLLFKKKK